MNLLCGIGKHKWNHCVCSRCGLKRNEDHLWNGCVCKICGKKRDEGHRWNGCRCTVCAQTRDQDHRWNGCKCSVCSAVRDQGHDWDGCTCRRCKAVRDRDHVYDLASVLAQTSRSLDNTVVVAKEAIRIGCTKCGHLDRMLLKGKNYCPECLHEVKTACVDWGGTSLKYEVTCSHCGYKATYSVCDSY